MSPNRENPQTTTHLRPLLEAAPESVLLVDKSGRILLANAWVVGAFGYSRRELAGRKAEDLIVPRFRDKYRHTLHGTFAQPPQKSKKHIPLSGRRKNGKEFPIELSLDVVNLGGDKMGILVICDVTERSQIEQELQEAHEKLRERVRDGAP